MRIFWQALFWANWLVILWFWWYGSGQMFFAGLGNVLIALGRLAGLVAGFFILLQFFLMGRNPLLEKYFGLDRLSRIHQLNGKLAIIVLVFHPLFITLGYARVGHFGAWAQFLQFWNGYEYVSLAVVGFALLLAVVFLALSIIRLRLRYETWYLSHLFVYLAIALVFWHQFAVGTDFAVSPIFHAYWIALYVFIFGSHLVFRIARPFYLLEKHDFRIARLVRETPSAISIYITGNRMNDFKIYPGQFMIVRFLNKKLWWQAHPFSLSMVPDGSEIRITPKEVGDFTKSLEHEIAAGTRVMIDGPYGIFTNLFSVSPKVLMVAGGIGITPIRSLSEEMLAGGKDVVMLYANRNEQETVFKKELDELAAKYQSRLVHVMSADPQFSGEKGILDEARLKRLVPDIAEREVYLCGPVPMMDSLVAIFKRLGLAPSRIHYERFAF